FPIELVRVGLGRRKGPDDVALVREILTLVDAAMGRRVPRLGNNGRPFGPVGVTGEFLKTAGHAAALEKQLGAVGEGVLRGIGVKVLIDVGAAVVPAAGGLGIDRPGVLQPTALVDIVDQEVTERAAAGPEEGMKA